MLMYSGGAIQDTQERDAGSDPESGSGSDSGELRLRTAVVEARQTTIAPTEPLWLSSSPSPAIIEHK